MLNDVTLAIDIINCLLAERNLEQITSERYLDVFTFPVRDYYVQIGFNFENESFEIPALQFITAYNDAVEGCRLHSEVISILHTFQKQGCRQFILSAMEQTQLEKTVSDCGITNIFEDLFGLDNHYATSKVDNGRLLLKSKGLNPDQTVLIGDTIHDYEVAQALGCSCILIANGHQSKQRLDCTGTTVLESLNEIAFLWK